MSDPNDTSTFYDRTEMLAAMQDPQYATSARYRDQIAAKVARSRDAGTISAQGEARTHNGLSERFSHNPAETAAVYGNGHSTMPGANPAWDEARKVSMPGTFFEGPEAIAAAMGAPQFQVDEGYRQAVKNKIDRSIREGFIGTDFQPLDPSQRYAR